MRLVRLSALAAVLVFATAVTALAAPITVYNTGVNATNTGLVGTSSPAFFWTLLSAPGGATEAVGSGTARYHNGAYFADTATAAWVSASSTGNHSAGGNYIYRMTFDLTGFDFTSAVISGVYGTDNDGFIRLNGGAAVATTGFAAFGSPTAFSMTSGFLAGLNTIDVSMNSVAGGQPTAFFVQFNSAQANPSTGPNPIPEPASLLLVGGGLALLVARVRRRRAR